MIIPTELFTAFNDVQYFDEPHEYYLDGKELISVTTLIHKYVEPFDEEYWSEFKGREFGIHPRVIRRAWKFINQKGTMKGSAIHDYAENLFLNKTFEYPKEMIYNHFGFDPVYKEYQITKKHVDTFYKHTKDRLIPVKTELILCDREALVGGMLDMLFWNVKAQEFQIWDWKTNKAFTHENKQRTLLGELGLLEESDIEIYSLQLEMYKQIIERNTDIKLGQSYIVWFSHRNDKYEVMETKDRRYHANLLLQNRIAELAA